MAKLSCTYFLILMLVFAGNFIFPNTIHKKDEGQCIIIIGPTTYCVETDCIESCYSGYNGVGKCIRDTKIGGDPRCVCVYNC
ncbi:unnamed protein product [Cochlearia groenlandica]